MGTDRVLKYAPHIQVITQGGYECPPAGAAERTLTAFRWCTNPPAEGYFSPQAVRNPPRLTRAEEPAERCSCWGLSMHISLEASVAAFKVLEKSIKGARKIFGDHVAEGRIVPGHGRVTPPNHAGHFDLHEYADGNVVAAFHTFTRIPSA